MDLPPYNPDNIQVVDRSDHFKMLLRSLSTDYQKKQRDQEVENILRNLMVNDPEYRHLLPPIRTFDGRSYENMKDYINRRQRDLSLSKMFQNILKRF